MTAPTETDRGELGDRGELDATDPPRCEHAADLPPVQDATSGRHEWINLRGIVSCRKCGVCRPHDWAKRDMRCRGVVHVELRAAEPCDLCGGTGAIDLDAEAAPDCYEHLGSVPCSCAGGRR